MSGDLDLGKRGLQAALCLCVCAPVCVCVRPCGSALEPLGTHRNVAALGSPNCPGSAWKWPPGKQKGGEEGEGRGKPRASNPPSPNPASDKGQFMPSLSRGSKGGGLAKLGSLRPPPEPKGCAQAGRGAGVCLRVRGQRGQEHQSPRPGALPEGQASLSVHRGRGHATGSPGKGISFLSSPGEGCQAFPDLPNTNPLWEEEKLSREGDRHGNQAELTRLAWRGERCLVQRPRCEFPFLSIMLLAGIPPSRGCFCAVRPGRPGPGRLR